MTNRDWSPFHLLRSAPRDALIAKLEEQAKLNSEFALKFPDKDVAAFAQNLADTYSLCVELIKSDMLVELLTEVRTMIPALNAAKAVLEAEREHEHGTSSATMSWASPFLASST